MMMMRDLEEVLKYIPISRFLETQPVITFSKFSQPVKCLHSSPEAANFVPKSRRASKQPQLITNICNPSAYDEATQFDTISFSLKPLNALSQSRDKLFQP